NPTLKGNNMIRENRVVLGGNLRAASSTNEMRISGMAARYDVPTIIGSESGKGAFREIIAPGAFSYAVNAKQDTRFYINHNPNRIMGRVSAGTLQLRDTADGLAFSAILPNTEDGRSVYESIKRGDMNECSFGFDDCDDDWSVEDIEGRRMPSRRI